MDLLRKVQEKLKNARVKDLPRNVRQYIQQNIQLTKVKEKIQSLWKQQKVSSVFKNSINNTKDKLKAYNFEARFKNGFNNVSKKIGRSLKSPKAIVAICFLTFVVVTVVSLASTFTYAVAVSVNGNQLGYVFEEQQAEELLEQALAKYGEDLGVVSKTDDQITYERVWVKKKDCEANLLDDKTILAAITPYIEAYNFVVEGEVLATLASEQEIDKVLNGYIDYVTQPSETNKVFSAEFVQNVYKEKIKASIEEITTADAVLDMLKEGKVTTVDYTIQKNDSLWAIARKHDMYTQEILDANPDITEETILQPGQVLKLSKVEPYLTVSYTGEKVVREVIPFDVQTKTDYSLASGKRIVKQYGQDGEKEVTFTYTAQNDKIIEKTVIKEDIITKPVTQIVAQGPAVQSVTTVATSRGSGSISGMSWPLSGRITSYYGYRRGGFHTGIDINGSVGQPYYAAADGKVIAAGWYGNYGRMILIDHGNGVATRYAHSSQLLVSVGSTVKKGQTIGYVGTTGKTTGPHLHFEVIINGSTVNPLNYIK